jgi:hypothetical protein
MKIDEPLLAEKWKEESLQVFQSISDHLDHSTSSEHLTELTSIKEPEPKTGKDA